MPNIFQFGYLVFVILKIANIYSIYYYFFVPLHRTKKATLRPDEPMRIELATNNMYIIKKFYYGGKTEEMQVRDWSKERCIEYAKTLKEKRDDIHSVKVYEEVY